MRMPETPREQLSRRIREVRLERGWSQEHLADVSGLHRTYVGDVERGVRNISVDNIGKIAKALGVPVKALFDS